MRAGPSSSYLSRHIGMPHLPLINTTYFRASTFWCLQLCATLAAKISSCAFILNLFLLFQHGIEALSPEPPPAGTRRAAVALTNSDFYMASIISTFHDGVPYHHPGINSRIMAPPNVIIFPQQGDFNIAFSFAMPAVWKRDVGKI